MIAPELCENEWFPPDLEWLVTQKIEDKSARAIAREIGASHDTVNRWYAKYDKEEVDQLVFEGKVMARHMKRIREGYPNLYGTL